MRIKKRTIIFVIMSVATIMVCCTIISLYFSSLSENTLPKQVEFKINNPKIQSKIETQVNALTKHAIKENKKRTLFLDDIAHVLAQYDIIDNYSVRLGFDEKLIISANVQKPVLAVHVKNGDVYIVGSGMKIIAKNPNNFALHSIPNIFFPEIQIKDKKDNPIKFEWFLEQIHLINNNIQWYDKKVTKITWTDSVGFSIKLENSDENNITSDARANLIVYLGHKNIDLKVDKFKIIANVLQQKLLKPREIDLGLLERAFIK